MPAEISTLVELYQNSTTAFAKNPLIGRRNEDGSWAWTSYEEFGDMIDKARGGLASLGIEKGDRVAIISDNRLEWAVGAYATYSLGAAWVPMYEAETQEDWVHILKDSGAKVLFAATDEIRSRVDEIRESAPDLGTIVVIEDAAGGDAINFSELLSRGADSPVPITDVAGSDLAGLIYTSGTTGKPKGVMLTHSNFTSNVNAISEIFPLAEEDRSASFLPWAHSFGQTVELHTLVFFGSSMGLTSAKTLVRDMPEVRPTILVSVPKVFNSVYDGILKKMEAEGGATKKIFDLAVSNGRKREQLMKRDATSRWVEIQNSVFDKLVFTKVRDAFGGRLRYAFSGGAAISTEVAEFISLVGITVYEGYGLTETSPIVTCNIKGARRIGSVGRVIPRVTVTIDTAVTGDPEIGEIVVHGPNVMKGYYNLPEANDEVFTDDHGFRTGDLGHVDDDGYLFIRGRIKEQYKLENGKYVVPSPIEEQLQLSGYVMQAMVYGEQRPYNVALVVPDFEYLKLWAAENGIDTSDTKALLANEQVRELYVTELKKTQANVKRYEQVRDFVLEDDEFSPENGLLTPSLKVKRRAVMAKYGDQIDDMYEGGNPLLGRD